MLRESPPYDFQNIFNATSCKMICRIQFSIYFWVPDKIDGIMVNYINLFFNENTAIIQSILSVVKSEWKIGFHGSFYIK